MVDKTIKRAIQTELRRLGFVRVGTSKSGSSYYERHNCDIKRSDFGTTDVVRLSDHYHPTVFDGYEYDISGFEDLEDLIAEIQSDFQTN